MKKNEIFPDFLLEIAATAFHPTLYGQKKMKKSHGVAHRSAHTWKTLFD